MLPLPSSNPLPARPARPARPAAGDCARALASRARRSALWFAVATLLAACAGAPPVRAPAPAPARQPELAAFSARLTGGSTVPPSGSAAAGELVAVLNRQTGLLRWKLSFSGLSGRVRSAHFHSPGMSEEIAPAVASLGRSVTSPAEGRVMLTPKQRADLLAGQWYVNIRTARYPDGELRGQLIERH